MYRSRHLAHCFRFASSKFCSFAAVHPRACGEHNNGADAVICFRFDSSSMGAGNEEEFIEVTSYGTAVRLG
ncbi:MAG TPA: heavy metal-binding domain-containing protein [Acidithiobacillus sp.]|nr:heavy metal-binding domain-containing protein [Acidithiobacillus sp.]